MNMRPLKALAIIAVGAFATNDAETSLTCSSSSTIYTTLPASPVTRTIYTTGHGPSAKASEKSSTSADAKPTHVLATTQVISMIEGSQSSQSSPSKGQGPYSFVASDGKTTWLGGKTPPGSTTFDIVTSYVTLQPLPVIATIKEQKSATATIPYDGKIYIGFGKAGWNATTFATVKTGSGGLLKSTNPVFISYKRTTFNGTAYPEHYPPGKAPRSLVARDAGVIMVASVDGATVSWTSNFDGATSATAATTNLAPDSTIPSSNLVSTAVVASGASIAAPSTTVPIYPWDLSLPAEPISMTPSSAMVVALSSPMPNQPNTSESASSFPSTTVGIYPWDLSPQRSAVSVNTTPGILKSAPQYLNTSSTSVYASAQTSSCSSAPALFTVTFDDLPHFDVSSDTSDTNIPPIFNPYHKLYRQDHFSYVPPPSDPFPPKSPPQLAVHRANNSSDALGSPDTGLEQAGEIGAGPRLSDSAYRIDAHSMWFGCSDGGHTACEVTINGYADDFNGISVSQTFDVPPCPGLKGCSLSLVQFKNNMVGLSGLQMLASVRGTSVDYYMDDLVLSWSNTSCAAQQERVSAQ